VAVLQVVQARCECTHRPRRMAVYWRLLAERLVAVSGHLLIFLHLIIASIDSFLIIVLSTLHKSTSVSVEIHWQTVANLSKQESGCKLVLCVYPRQSL